MSVINIAESVQQTVMEFTVSMASAKGSGFSFVLFVFWFVLEDNSVED